MEASLSEKNERNAKQVNTIVCKILISNHITIVLEVYSFVLYMQHIEKCTLFVFKRKNWAEDVGISEDVGI